MEKRIAVYAGSFDPPTNGHFWMIKNGAELFDQLIVAITVNPEKKYTFPPEERIKMILSCIPTAANVRVSNIGNKFLVRYAAEIGAKYILRGIRTEHDYAYEQAMRHFNGDFGPEISTVCYLPPRELLDVSSGFVKGLVGPEGWEKIVKNYVPAPVFLKILEWKLGEKWAKLAKKLGLSHAFEPIFSQLMTLYSEPHRHYHGINHLWQGLKEINEARNFCENPEAVEMAFWFHDAVYEIGGMENEEASAVFAMEKIEEMGLNQKFQRHVSYLILATKHLAPPLAIDAQILADADLSSLGQNWDEFEENNRLVRKEHAAVSEKEFTAGRQNFFKGFIIGRKSVFSSPFFREKYEKTAQENIGRCIMAKKKK